MAEITLTAHPALAESQAVTVDGTSIRPLPLTRLTGLMPPPGGAAALARALGEMRLDLPGAGGSLRGDAGEVLWFGRNVWLLIGAAPSEAVSDAASLVDLSDGWTMVELDGPDARDVLARLTPLDLRPTAFAIGATARTELRHMMSSITRTGEDRFRVMVFRSMAGTLMHDLETALRGVAARRRLKD